jgi:hypothetical protein
LLIGRIAMRIVRIHSGAKGGSLLEDLDADLQADALGHISQMMPATNVFIRVLRHGLYVALHCAPRRQLVFIATGIMEVESTNSEVRRVHAGDAILVEDTVGRGHLTRIIEGPATCVYVPVPQDFEVGTFCRSVRGEA